MIVHLAALLALALVLSSCQGTPAATPPAGGAAAAPAPARAAVAPADARRARGAGHVYQGEDRVQFSFIVKNTGLPGGISTSGTLGGTKFAMQGMAADVGIVDGRVTFTATGTFNGQPARFTVEGTDDAAADAIALSVAVEGAGDYRIAGPLKQGHVDIERE